MATVPLSNTSQTAYSSDWLIEQLETAKSTFDDETSTLPTHQQNTFSKVYNSLRDPSAISSSQKSRVARVHALLMDAYVQLGSEVFLLCALATTITNLSSVPQRGLITCLRRWWTTTSHPHGLTAVASEICDQYAIESLVSRKRKITGMRNSP